MVVLEATEEAAVATSPALAVASTTAATHSTPTHMASPGDQDSGRYQGMIRTPELRSSAQSLVNTSRAPRCRDSKIRGTEAAFTDVPWGTKAAPPPRKASPDDPSPHLDPPQRRERIKAQDLWRNHGLYAPQGQTTSAAPPHPGLLQDPHKILLLQASNKAGTTHMSLLQQGRAYQGRGPEPGG